MLHFPVDPELFAKQKAAGKVPFYRMRCGEAALLRSVTIDPSRVDCPGCASGLSVPAVTGVKFSSLLAVAQPGSPPPLRPIDDSEIDLSEFEEVEVDLDDQPAAPMQRAALVVAPYELPPKEVLLARMMLDPELDPQGSDGFGSPDIRSSLLPEERAPLAELLAMIAGFGFSAQALPILQVLHRLCHRATSVESADFSSAIEDETAVEPHRDIPERGLGEDSEE